MRVACAWRWIVVVALAVASVTVGQVVLPGDTGEAAPRASIYLEDSPAAQELVEEAARLRRENRIPDAVAIYQQIIEQYPHKLMTRGGSRYYDTARWVQQELASDRDLTATYRRMYEATAERELVQAAEAADEAAALEAIVERYLLCTSGLEAGLRLAGLYVAQGNLSDAGAVLDELASHPDLAQQAARYHMLQAAVGLFAGQSGRFNEHRATLEQLGATEKLTQIDRWAATLRRPEGYASQEGILELPEADIPESLGQPLWSLDTRPPTTQVENVSRANIRSSQRMPFPILPVLDGSVLYLNNTRQVIAMDRISHRVLWQYDGGADGDPAMQQIRRQMFSPSDVRSVLLNEGRLYAVVGQTPEMFGMWQRAIGTSLLVCLNPTDGSVLWQTQPGELDRTLERGYFHGTPLAGPGRIYVLIRRSQAGFFETFVVALDARTGQLLWRRHLTSASSAIVREQPPFAQMTAAQGRVFVVDHQGAVTCLDGRTGAIRWLSITAEQRATTEAAIARGSRLLNAGFETPPILIEAGLLVNAFSDANPVLLNPETGEKLRDLTAPAIARAQFLMQCGDDVLSVGRSTHLLDGRTLEPRWSRDLEGVTSSTTFGLPWVSRNAVWIAAGERMNVLSLADGSVLMRSAVEESGNVVAVGPQLLIASAEKLCSYMDWNVAYRSLRQQVADHPTDPRPGLSLAELALATNHRESVLEGVDHVVTAMRLRGGERTAMAQDPLQRLVFEQLRSMVDPARTPDVQLRERLFERLAAVTAGPADEVVYLLARASFMVETDRPAQAVEHYQAILKNPELSSQPYKEGFITQQAGQEARQRMTDVVEKAPHAYARFEAEATHRLAELMAASSVNVEALVELARQYPLATAAARALLAAGDATIAQGDASTGIMLLRRAYLQNRSQADAERIVGRLAEVLQEMNQPRQAVQWLRKAMRDYPQIMPVRRGVPTPPQEWLGQLLDQPDTDVTLPALALPLQKPKVLKEKLLLPTRQPLETQPRDAILTFARGQLRYRQGDDLEVRWQVPAPGEDFEVLSFTDDRVLLWRRDQSQLLALDTRSGQEAWAAVDVSAVLERIASDQPGDDGNAQIRDQVEPPVNRLQEELARQRALRFQLQQRQGVMIVPQPAGNFERDLRRHLAGRSLITVNDTVVTVCDALGRVTGIDRLTGQVLWAMRCPFELVTHIEMNEDFVAVAGLKQGDERQARSSVVVLDAMTGELRHASIEMDHPNWMGLTPSGVLAISAGGELVGFDVRRGEELWRQAVGQRVVRGTVLNDRILIADEGRSAIMIEPTTGRRFSIIAAADRQEEQHPVWRYADGIYHVLTAEQVMAMGESGDVLWRDAIFDDPKNLYVQLLSDKYVLAIGFDVGQALQVRQLEGGIRRIEVARDQGHSYRLYMLDRRNGMILRQQRLGPIPELVDPALCILLNNRLIMGTAGHTIIVPGAAE